MLALRVCNKQRGARKTEATFAVFIQQQHDSDSQEQKEDEEDEHNENCDIGISIYYRKQMTERQASTQCSVKHDEFHKTFCLHLGIFLDTRSIKLIL